MKKFSPFFLLLLILLGVNSFAQVIPGEVLDTVFTKKTIGCGTSAEYFKSLGRSPVGPITPLTIPTAFPASAIEHCGKFDIYYEDLISTSPLAGYSAPSGVGAARRNTLCAVLTYVQSVYDFSNIPASAPIRLHVNQSFAPIVNPAPSTTTFLATAGPTFINTGTPQIIYGFVRDYTVSGIDPGTPTDYHAELTTNFDQAYDAFGSPLPINWHDDYLLPIPNCRYDLFSVLLHEVGHTLGWLSYINYSTITGLPESVLGNDQYSGIDFILQKGTVSPLSLTPLVMGPATAPFMNPAIAASPTALTSNDIWISPFAAPDNHPVYSGLICTPWTGSFAPNSILSHLDDQMLLYSTRSRISPGDVLDYSMGPFGIHGILRRNFTDVEINTIIGLGYPFNPSYPGLSALPNLPPYSTKMAGYTNYFDQDFSETVVADFPPLVNNGSSLVINLATDPTLIDFEGNPISIAPGTLVNIRGCGNGGNNHNQLVVSGGGQIITFTPRPDFYGRAQFGFKLFDGTERGSYVFYTIDVLRGTNVSCAAGSNIILNADLEEGTEVKKLGADELVDASQREQDFLREGRFNQGIHFADAQPYCFLSNGWGPFGSGEIIKESWIECSGTTYRSAAGSWNTSFPIPWGWITPNASGGIGDRYKKLYGNYNYFNLCTDMQHCSRYVLEFDYYAQTTPIPTGTIIPLTVGFANTATYPATAALTYSFVNNITITSGSWQHVVIPFTYCSTTPASILNLRQTAAFMGLFIDNLELVEDLSPAPPLIVSITPPTPSICIGSSKTLNSTVSNILCNATYSWTPGGQTTSSITDSPVVTTNYGLTVNDGCRSTTVNNLVTVNPLPVVTFGAIAPVCSGGAPITLTTGSPAGGSYTGTNVSAGIFTPPVVTSSTSYVITYTFTDINGCTNSATQNITVNPLPIVTFGAIPNPCSGGAPITLTTGSPAGGAYTGPNVSGGIFTPPVVTSSTPYVITYTFTDLNGCTNSANQTITVDVCAGPCGICNEMAPSGILSVSPLQYNVYCITTPMTISGTVTIALSEVQIAPGMTITVPSGSTLNIYGSHLYSCTDMWQGIIVKPGGRINVINWSAIVSGFGLINRSPMIEDARTAITIQAGSTLTTGILNIRNTTFNRNEYSIKINGYAPVLATYPFNIVASVFTCREINYIMGSLNWPQTNAVRATTTPASPLQTPHINSAIYLETSTAAFLKAPFVPGLTKSQTAIQLNGVGTVAFIPSTPTPSAWYEIKIGANGLARYNLFDNHKFCIDAYNSNFTSVNNIFQKTIVGNNGGGIAINANAKDANCRAQVISGTPTGNFNNLFFDCSRAINTVNYFENIFKYCDVRSTQSGPTVIPPPTNPFPSANHRGEHGFFVLTNRFRIIDMSDNKLYNVENGITFNANFGPYSIGGVASSPSGQYSGQVNVDRNEIAPHLPTFTIVDQYVRSAISLSNVITALQLVPGTDVRVNNNNIKNVNKGIFATNWAKKNVITNANIITLRTDYYTATASQFGISHASNSAGTAFGNSINGNTVKGTSIFANPNIRGIQTSRCNDQRVACNVVNGTTHGIEFSSTEPNTKFDNNSMTNHKYGYVLSSNGVIGIQGTNSNPTDNAWFGAWTFPNYKTATLFSSSQFSKMYIRTSSVSGFNPDLSGVNVGGTAGTDEFLFANGSLILSTTPIDYVGCAIIIGGGGGGGMPGSAIALLEDIAQDNISHLNNDTETKYINKNQLFRLLKADPSLTSSSVILQNFFTASLPTVRETYTNIEDDIALGDMVNAQSKTNALLPANSIEDNYKTFFTAYLKHQTDTIIESDSLTVVNMANGCPFTDGDVIYQARALYNSIYRSNVYFEDNCPDIPERSFDQIKTTEGTLSSFDVLVYPNPNSGSFSLVPFSSDISELNVKVVDVNGKIVYEKMITGADRLFNLNIDSENGIYMLFVSNPKTNDNIVKRIVIQK